LTHCVSTMFLTVIFLIIGLLATQHSQAAPMATTISVGPIWPHTLVDHPGAGQFASIRNSSIVIDALDVPHIGYGNTIDGLYGQLKYAQKIGNDWATETIDAAGGAFPSLALAPSGYPGMSYYVVGPDALIKYAVLTTTGWISEVVMSNVQIGGSGFNTSLAFDKLGNPHIVYPDYSLGHDALWYAHKTGTGWITSTVDAEHGRAPVIDLDSLDHAHILYTDRDNNLLRYAEWTGSLWLTDTLGGSAESAANLSTSPSALVMDQADHAHVAYFEQPGNALVYGSNASGIWITNTITTLPSVGEVKLALGKTGEPQLVFTKYGASQTGYAHRQGAVWTVEYVTADVADSISLALDSEDAPRVSYIDVFSRALYTAAKPRSVLYFPAVLK
jgi:hypothetical protein